MVTIRPATQSDQATIVSMVRAANLNPVKLHWANFLIAEEDGRVVGIGQLRPHGSHADGSRELASLVVDSAYQRQGIGGRLVRQLLTCAPAPIYLFCEDRLEHYYAHFGFRGVERAVLPPPLARLYLAGRLVTGIAAWLSKKHGRLIAMRWDGA